MDLHRLLEDYFTALAIVQCDTVEDIARSLAAPGESSWLAEVDGAPAGCVALREVQVPGLPAGTTRECKRLYVRPEFRGLGIAARLLDAMERHGAATGIEWIYLDSKDDLEAALRLYAERGYRVCERYNDNPQATVFMRKRLAAGLRP